MARDNIYIMEMLFITSPFSIFNSRLTRLVSHTKRSSEGFSCIN
uniref:Uncharacterized protein n=1 Tax=Utricularia reniformis TaxID=192314 RepID=A0A1Y0B2U4_9LAMI|nr:hypothetical protein AEK19_MT1524 [Utricularia reniformis]ART31714.1 hypothetical protein AEK19_MT1524 [Utricularia reniformis]